MSSPLKNEDESAERYLIGAMMDNGFGVAEDLGVHPFAFANEDRRRIWIAAENLHAHGEGSTIFAVAPLLGKDQADLRVLGSDDASFPIQQILLDCAIRVLECAKKRRGKEIGKDLTCGMITVEEAAARLNEIAEGGNTDSAESLFADVVAIVEEGLDPELPTIAHVLEDRCALYSGRINELHGEPSVGKTNIALALAKSVLERGGHVLFLDPEDSGKSAIRRLKSFGCEVATIARFFHHVHSPTAGQYRSLVRWARRVKPKLVVVDGVAESMGTMGLDEDKPTDFLQFARERLKPFADNGAATLVSDHVTKSTEGRGRWARGTGAKLGRYDGAVYSAELGKAYTPTEDGFVKLRVSKDRNGGVGSMGQVILELHFRPGDHGTEIEWQKPKAKAEFKPTTIMERISRRLEEFPESTKNDLRQCGKAEYVDLGILALEEDGYLKSERVGQRMKFTLVREYREGQSNES